jgi:hypothetical protein
MLLLGSIVCAGAGALLLLLTLGARPTRGENLTAAHLVTGPMAIVFTIGVGIVSWAAPLPSALALVVLGLLAPGAIVGLTFLPLAAYGGRHARIVKAAAAVVVAAPFLLGHGAAVHTLLPWVGAAVLAAVGIAGTWFVLELPLRRLRARFALRRGPAQPSEWEDSQAAWQRGEWAKVPPDATVAALLPHARALAPDVQAACHERLAAHPELDAALAAALRGEETSDALWYLTHHYPRARQPFAAPMRELLARRRANWPDRLRADSHPRPWTGDVMAALECAAAVLLAGGDVRAELLAWHAEFTTMPKFRDIAKGIERLLKRTA